MKTKYTVLGIIVAIAAIVGGYYYPGVQLGVGTSDPGSTFTNAKIAAVVIDASVPGSTGTSTSLQNTDANDRFITGFRVGCNNVGTSRTAYTGADLASWQLTIGTSTTASPATFVGFANVANGFVLGTSTKVLTVASTTLQTATSSLASRWPSGSYVTYTLNATNTAVCTFGVDYLSN